MSRSRLWSLLSCLCLSITLVASMAAQEPAKKAPSPQDWSGPWYSDFGFLDLTVDGNEVTGTYSCCEGEIRGTVKGSQLEFTWKDPIYGSGWGYWYWQDGSWLRGIFANEGDFGTAGGWNAVRRTPADLGDSPARFTVTGSHPRYGEFKGEALLDLSGETIRGTMEGQYDLEARGKPFRHHLWNRIEGTKDGERWVLTWSDPNWKTEGEIVLEGAGDTLTGTWQPHFRGDSDERLEVTFRRAG